MGNFNRGDRSGDRGGRDRFRGRDSGRGFDRGGRDAGRPIMHQAVCDECGKKCEVPFRPTGEKPVLCSECFGGGRNDRRPRERSFNREERVMYTAVCDKCGKDCEVPFKPTAGKPVYCNDCFDKNDNSNRGGNGASKELLESINSKLEKIMQALNIPAEKIEKKADKKKVSVDPEEMPELLVFEDAPEAPKKVKKAAVKKVSAKKK